MFLELFIALAGGTALTGKGFASIARQSAEDAYLHQQGFNEERQHELERMMRSTDPEVRKKFDRMLGRTPDRSKNSIDKVLAVRQISLREGWQYFYIPELGSDPTYVRLSGGKWPAGQTPGTYVGKSWLGKERAIELNEETDRRKAWIDRCPHGHEVDVFPMDYEDEERYQVAVGVRFAMQQGG